MNKAELERKVSEYASGNTRAFDYIYDCTNRAVYFAALYIVQEGLTQKISCRKHTYAL